MQLVTKQFKVYEYNELGNEAKEAVLSYFRGNNDYYFLSDDMAEKLSELLKANKLSYSELPKVYFSLSYCQGDGAMFEGTVYYKSYTVDIKQSGMYYHYNSKNIDMYSTKTGKQASDKVYNEFNDLYVDICKQLERYGYDYIEYENSENSILENINANGYKFLAKGTIFD